VAVASPPTSEPALGAYGPVGRSEWRDVDWRAYQHWVTVRGTPVNYIEMGSGDPLLFVHGLSGSWQNWLENIPHFARRRRVLAIDLPGFGDSPMPAEEISIPNYGRIVDDFLDAVGVPDERPIALVGNSMGGFVSAEVAISFSQRVGSLVLVSSAGISSEQLQNERLEVALRRLEFFTTWLGARGNPRTLMRPRYKKIAKFVFEHPDQLPGALLYEQAKGSGKPGFTDALIACASHPIRDRLAEIRASTLVLWGERDRIVPPRDGDVFAEAIQGARRLVYEDTGHVPQLERPARFNRDVEAFIDETQNDADSQ
jgi:pimeloyl-ACP methyl ester carboxylesterase